MFGIYLSKTTAPMRWFFTFIIDTSTGLALEGICEKVGESQSLFMSCWVGFGCSGVIFCMKPVSNLQVEYRPIFVDVS